MPNNIRLKTARVAKQLTQLQLAKQIGTKEIEISRFETGRAQPDKATKERIAEILQKEVYEIFDCNKSPVIASVEPVKPMKTDNEIRKICEALWIPISSWNLSYDQLVRLAYTPGNDSGDVVYTSPTGSCMTRHMCHNLIKDFSTFSHGFVVAYRYLETEQRKESKQ
jgi:transcriptional regulator with XRE-family HTH domain